MRVSGAKTATAVMTAALALLPASLPAHEIPTDVTVQAFLKPEGDKLRLVVRVPLAAMRDMTVPTDPFGYLDLSRAEPVLRDAAILWIADYVELYEGETPLLDPEIVAARVSLPSDRSFESYERALAQVTGERLPDGTEIYWAQGLLDVLFEYPIASENSKFSINPGLERLGMRVVNILRFIEPDGTVRAFDFPGNPGLIRLDPQWHHVAFRFVELGFYHILGGIDHLLFLFCLVIPFRRFRSLVILVTSFTIAHSITLIASAFGFAPDALWFPPLIETLIAISILYMAFENIVGAKLRRRWLITFGFGLVHGFGFSFLLRETLQFAGSHLLTSLLAFNAGVELGQILVLLLLVPLLGALFRYAVSERVGTIILSALVAHTAWHWMIERGGGLSEFDWPTFDAALLVTVIRWLMLIVLVAAVVWVVSVVRRPSRTTSEDQGSR
ncbi:MAG: HupE/UreJ family protein [Vicinamibacteria bacterium]